MMKRIITGILLLSVAVLVLGACSNDSSKGNTEKENKEDLVATVDGKGISKRDYEKELDVMKATYEQQGMPEDQMDSKQKEELEKSVLDQMINAELLLQIAEKDGIAIEDKEVDAELEKIKGNFEDEKQFEEALKKNEMTEKELKAQLKKQMTVNKYLDSKIGKIEATDEEIKVNYDQYKEIVKGQEQEPEELEKVKAQLEQQIIAEKENEKISKLLEELRKENEDKIEIIKA